MPSICWWTFSLGLLALLLAVNVLRTPRWPGPAAVLLFLPAWTMGELPFHVIAVEGAVAAALIPNGALDAWPGVAGLAMVAAGWVLHLVAWRRSDGVIPNLEALGLPTTPPRRGPLELIWPFHARRDGVTKTRLRWDTEAGWTQPADLYRRPASGDTPAPILVYIHGGGWVIGARKNQGLPLMIGLARAGWICVSVEYRLSPRATFPDHVIDVKRGLARVRAQAAEWGGDPDRIYVAGDSAGGHLATLAALTPDRRDWQPTFEDADTAVAGGVIGYGIYDFTSREGQWHHGSFRRLIERAVIKRRLAEAPEAFRDASPWDHLRPDAPPLLLLHGVSDSVVPIGEARAFRRHAETAAPGRVTLLEVPGGQHAFNLFRSRRSDLVVPAAIRWLQDLDAAGQRESSPPVRRREGAPA